ncbi:MAG: hypothetical protein ACR2LL_11215 [Nitrosopumilus sp.]|uniref:hypothetical protein n=1 Tax=Nitrosopumilus sp. TaxID=2024843 RepID=UPI00292D82F8|nr:hypothetical protein [Nitrosopumilus sp.]
MVHKEMYAVISKSMIPSSDMFSIVASYDNTEKILLTAEIIDEHHNNNNCN